MKQLALRGLALYFVVAALAYYFAGVLWLLVVTGLFATVLARSMMEIADEMHQAGKRVALHSVNGSYYSFQGITVNVVEDDDYCQWVAADEVRKIIGHGAPDRMLALTYPDGWCEMGKPPKGYLRDDALLLYLAKESSLRGVKFKVWVERNIVHQAKKQRERFGIRLSDPRAPDLQPNHLRDTEVPRDMQSTLPQG